MTKFFPFMLIFTLIACTNTSHQQVQQAVQLPLMSIPMATNGVLTSVPTPISAVTAYICRNDDVKVAYGDSDAKYQSVTTSIILTNVGTSSCRIALFPHVRLLDATARALEIGYHFFKEESRDSYLLVESRQSVGFLMVWKNWCQSPIAGGVKIQLTLPESTLPIDVPVVGTGLDRNTIYTKAYCTQPGKKAEIWISQFAYNVPIPLHP